MKTDIAAYIPAIISSNTTPKPFFIFLSIILIGKGFKMSKILNNINASINLNSKKYGTNTDWLAISESNNPTVGI